MARVHAFGSEFNASVVEGPLPNGNYKMMAQERFSRGEAGTVIEVKPSEIISTQVGGATFNLGGQIAQPALPQPLVVGTGIAPQTAVSNEAPPGTPLVVNSPVPVTGTEIAARLPLLSPTAIRPPVRTPMAAPTTPKLNSLANAFANFTDRVEAAADKVLQRMEAAGSNVEDNVRKLDTAIDPIVAVSQNIAQVAGALSNGAPPLPASGNSAG